MKVLVRNAQIVDPSSTHHLKKRDLLIENGVISKITAADSSSSRADKVLSGKKLKVSPGWYDMFATFGDPGYEYKEDLASGTVAAEHGGFTGISLLPNTKPVIQTKNDISYIRNGNPGRIVQADVIGAITKDCAGEDLTEMIDLHEAGAIAFSDGLVPVWHGDIILKTLQYLQKFDGLLINRPEDLRLNLYGVMHEGPASTSLGMKGMPGLAEEVIVSRDLQLLEYAGGRLHFANISSVGSVDLIRKAKRSGLRVTCDVAAHQCVLDDSNLHDFDTNYKVNPPLRESSDIKALIKGISDGTIDAIVSSHQPQDVESKKEEFDKAEFGIIGLQTVMPCLTHLSNQVGWDILIDKVAIQPRNILGIETPQIEAKKVANMTVFDPDEEWTFDEESNRSKSNNSPFFDQKLRGKVIAVFNNKKYNIFQ